MVTNGSRLYGLELPWERMFGVGISVNEVEPELYAQATGSDWFRRLEEGIHYVWSRGAPIVMTFVIGQWNLGRIDDYLRYVAQWPTAKALPILAMTPIGPEDYRPEYLLERRDVREAFEVAKAHAPPGLVTRWPTFRRGRKGRLGGCDMSTDVLVVNGRGHVAVCCRGPGPRAELGNIWLEGRKAWRNEALRRFRCRVAGTAKPAKCRACPEPEV
jgi:radical SAM protein with 4Fe4S-binding SPASM domain